MAGGRWLSKMVVGFRRLSKLLIGFRRLSKLLVGEGLSVKNDAMTRLLGRGGRDGEFENRTG